MHYLCGPRIHSNDAAVVIMLSNKPHARHNVTGGPPLAIGITIIITALLLLQQPVNVHSANVLCLLGATTAAPTTPPHLVHIAFWHQTLLPALLKAGHNVTVLTSHTTLNTNSAKIHFIPIVPAVQQAHGNREQRWWWSPSRLWSGTVYERIVQHYSALNAADTALLSSPAIRQWINQTASPSSAGRTVVPAFDVVLHEPSQGASILGVVPFVGHAPLVTISADRADDDDATMMMTSWWSTAMYVPHRWSAWSYEIDDDDDDEYRRRYRSMTLIERARNVSYAFFEWFYRHYVYMRNANRKARQLFDGLDITTTDVLSSDDGGLSAIERSRVLHMPAIAFGVDAAQSFAPTVWPIGGAQAQRSEAMDAELERFVNGSDAGVVLVNLGARLEDWQRRVVAKAMSLLPEWRFVWYTEGRKLRFGPPNVRATERPVAQVAILGHPKTRLLLTHGGRNSVIEAVWHAVPMLALIDGASVKTPPRQRLLLNALRAQSARIVRWTDCDASGERLAARMRQLLDTMTTLGDQYAINARGYRDAVFGTRLRTPLETAMLGIEAVLRLGNVNHLQLNDRDLYWWQKCGADVFAAFAAIVGGFVVIFVKHCCCWPNRRRRPPSREGDVEHHQTIVVRRAKTE